MEEFVPRGRHTVALRFLDPQPEDRILEVGCNQGYFIRSYLLGKVALVRGVDIDQAAIEYAKAKDGEEFYAQCDASALPFEDAAFD